MSLNESLINGLWIGPALSPLEQLTILSFIRQGYRFRLWVYNPPEGLPESADLDIADAARILPESRVFRYHRASRLGHGKDSVAGFSDLFRYCLLWEQGGWWSDMDITCIAPLKTSDNYRFRAHHKLKMVGNLMHCPPKSALMAACIRDTEAMVHSGNRDWLLPIRILNGHITALDLEKYIVEFTNPDSWYFIRKMLSPIRHPLPDHWRALHWNHTDWMRLGIAKDQWLPGSLYGHLLAQHGILPCQPDQETQRQIRHRLSIPWFAWRSIRNRLVS